MWLYPDPNLTLPLYQFLEPLRGNDELIYKFNLLSEHEKNFLATTATKFVLQFLFMLVVTILIATSMSLSTIYNLTYNQLTLANLVRYVLRTLPHIILFILGSIPYFVALMIVVLIIPVPIFIFLILLCGAIFYISIYMLFLAITTDQTDSSSFTLKIRKSITLLKQYTRPILSMILIWFIVTTGVNALAKEISSNNIFINIVFYLISVTVDFFIICYFYRLYMLTKKSV